MQGKALAGTERFQFREDVLKAWVDPSCVASRELQVHQSHLGASDSQDYSSTTFHIVLHKLANQLANTIAIISKRIDG